jgi:hypothetical protein
MILIKAALEAAILTALEDVENALVVYAAIQAFVGVIWGHLLMGLDLSMPGMMGAV